MNGRNQHASRLEIRPTERQCRDAGLVVYREPYHHPSWFLCNEFRVWKRVVASPAVVSGMGERLHVSHTLWAQGEELFGNYFEYRFRLKYPLPIHVPRSAMKLISLMCNRDPDAAFDDEGEEPEFWEQDYRRVHL